MQCASKCAPPSFLPSRPQCLKQTKRHIQKRRKNKNSLCPEPKTHKNKVLNLNFYKLVSEAAAIIVIQKSSNKSNNKTRSKTLRPHTREKKGLQEREKIFLFCSSVANSLLPPKPRHKHTDRCVVGWVGWPYPPSSSLWQKVDLLLQKELSEIHH